MSYQDITISGEFIQHLRRQYTVLRAHHVFVPHKSRNCTVNIDGICDTLLTFLHISFILAVTMCNQLKLSANSTYTFMVLQSVLFSSVHFNIVELFLRHCHHHHHHYYYRHTIISF